MYTPAHVPRGTGYCSTQPGWDLPATLCRHPGFGIIVRIVMRRLRLHKFLFLVACCVAISVTPHAGAVTEGDSTNAVIDELGAPIGVGTRGATLIYYYARGIVEFETGSVRRADLLSDTEARSRRERLISRRPVVSRATSRAAVGGAARTGAATSSGKEASGGDAERAKLEARLKKIEVRLAELAAAYAKSRTHWKRRQIKRERVTLEEEKTTLTTQLAAADGEK